MFRYANNPETQADRRADRRTFVVILGFTILSWIILSTSEHLEYDRAGVDYYWLTSWVSELTSHVAILLAIIVIPFLLNFVPLTLDVWRSKIPYYALGFFVFGGVHIALMEGLRHITYPLLLGFENTQSFFDIDLWVYELRKDAYTYLMVVLAFRAMRHIEQLRLEAQAIKETAQASGRLELKSGGRHVFLDANEILWAKAEANYVEIHTGVDHHLIRMTLTALEDLLKAAGDDHIRIHRSYLVHRDQIREVTPSGGGSAMLSLLGGENLPISRKYRTLLSSRRPNTSAQ